jgi:hypothetical protein
MRYVSDDAELAHLNYLLASVDTLGARIRGRVEVYNRKRSGAERRASRQLEDALAGTYLASSPEASASPFGPLCDAAARKVLADLIALLNAAFPDYDFSRAKAEDFARERGIAMVRNSIDAKLEGRVEAYTEVVKTPLWAAIDDKVWAGSLAESFWLGKLVGFWDFALFFFFFFFFFCAVCVCVFSFLGVWFRGICIPSHGPCGHE